MVTAVVCGAFDDETDAAILRVREIVRGVGIRLPPEPPHRPHFSMSAARVMREPDLDQVVETAASIAERHSKFPLVFHEVGRFGRAGVLWLGPAPTRELAALQRDVYRTLKSSWPPAFGERSSPRLWAPHCTLATRIPKPQLREIQSAVREQYQPIRGKLDGLAVILVGGHGDVSHVPLR